MATEYFCDRCGSQLPFTIRNKPGHNQLRRRRETSGFVHIANQHLLQRRQTRVFVRQLHCGDHQRETFAAGRLRVWNRVAPALVTTKAFPSPAMPRRNIRRD